MCLFKRQMQSKVDVRLSFYYMLLGHWTKGHPCWISAMTRSAGVFCWRWDPPFYFLREERPMGRRPEESEAWLSQTWCLVDLRGLLLESWSVAACCRYWGFDEIGQVSPYCCPTPPQTPDSCRAGPCLGRRWGASRVFKTKLYQDWYCFILFPSCCFYFSMQCCLVY